MLQQFGWCAQVEAMVRAKMECMDYIILCLEDSNDWSNATTRRLVMQVPNPCVTCSFTACSVECSRMHMRPQTQTRYDLISLCNL